MRFLVMVLAILLAPIPAESGHVDKKDNLGRPVVPTLDAINAISASGEASVGFNAHDFDLMFSLGVTGSNNDSGTDEKALLGVSAFLYVGQNAAVGLGWERPDLAQPNVMTLAPKAKMYLFRDPFANWNKGLMLTPLTWTVSTGDNDVLSGGAWSVDPMISAFVEFPVDFGALNVQVGIPYVFTLLSEDVPNGWGDWQGEVSFIWWWIR